MPSFRFTLVVLLLAVAGLLLAAPMAWACPGCKEAVAAADDENGTPEDSISKTGAAYSYSVLFMLGMLFTMLLGFGGAFYRIYRKARLSQMGSRRSLACGDSQPTPAAG